MDRDLLHALLKWPQIKRAEFQERAAILEYDAHMTRAEAEQTAFDMHKDDVPWQPSKRDA